MNAIAKINIKLETSLFGSDKESIKAKKLSQYFICYPPTIILNTSKKIALPTSILPDFTK